MRPKTAIQTPNAPQAIGAYSQAILTQSNQQILFISGQIPLDPATGELISGDFISKARQVFKNLEAICEAAGGNLNHIIKLNIFLLDLSQFQSINQLMKELFSEPYPARATVAVSALPKNAEIEIEAIMAINPK